MIKTPLEVKEEMENATKEITAFYKDELEKIYQEVLSKEIGEETPFYVESGVHAKRLLTLLKKAGWAVYVSHYREDRIVFTTTSVL